MKIETLQKAEHLNEEIKKLSDCVYFFSDSLKHWEERVRRRKSWNMGAPVIRFVNKAIRSSGQEGDREKPVMFLFATESVHGVEVEATPELVEVIRDFFQKKLDSKKEEFESLKD